HFRVRPAHGAAQADQLFVCGYHHGFGPRRDGFAVQQLDLFAGLRIADYQRSAVLVAQRLDLVIIVYMDRLAGLQHPEVRVVNDIIYGLDAGLAQRDLQPDRAWPDLHTGYRHRNETRYQPGQFVPDAQLELVRSGVRQLGLRRVPLRAFERFVLDAGD